MISHIPFQTLLTGSYSVYIYQQSYSLLMIVACSALYIMILIFMLGSNENDWYNEKNNRYNEKNNK